jgi:hypothetical protein
METIRSKRRHHLQKRALPYTLILFPPCKEHPQDHVFGTGSYMVEEEILVKIEGGGAYEERSRGKGGRATSSLYKSTLGREPPNHFGN